MIGIEVEDTIKAAFLGCLSEHWSGYTWLTIVCHGFELDSIFIGWNGCSVISGEQIDLKIDKKFPNRQQCLTIGELFLNFADV